MRGGLRTRLRTQLPQELNVALVRKRRDLVRNPVADAEVVVRPAPAVGVMPADFIRVAAEPEPITLPVTRLEHALAIGGLAGYGATEHELAGLTTLARRVDELAVDWVIAAHGELAIGWERITEDVDLLARACAALDEWAEAAVVEGPYR